MSVLVFATASFIISDLNLKQFCDIPGIFLFEKHSGIEFLESEYGHAAVFFGQFTFIFQKLVFFRFAMIMNFNLVSFYE